MKFEEIEQIAIQRLQQAQEEQYRWFLEEYAGDKIKAQNAMQGFDSYVRVLRPEEHEPEEPWHGETFSCPATDAHIVAWIGCGGDYTPIRDWQTADDVVWAVEDYLTED